MASLDSEQQFRRMTGQPIPSLVIRMAVPTAIGMMITVVYNTADTFFVSQINKSASAGVGAVYPIMAVIQAVGYGLGMGAGSLISRLLGKKEKEQAETYASSAFFLAILAGALVGCIGLCVRDPVLRLLGCSDTMLPYARDYALYVLLSAPISCSSFVLSNTLRAEGESNLSMWGTGIGGLINMALDPLFIFTFGMDAGGAALATAVSQCISFLIMGSFFLRGRSILHIQITKVSQRPADYWKILSTGLPTICRQCLGSLSSALLNIQAVVYGDAMVSAVTIAGKVYILTRNMVLGIGQGFQPVAGYNFGAGMKRRTWQAFVFATLLGSGVCILTSGGVAALAQPIMTWFSKDAEVIRYGREYLYFGSAVMPLMALSTYVNMLYQCLGFRAQATFLASCRQGIFFVPSILLLPLFFHRSGVSAAQPLADLLTCVISVPFLIAFYRKQIQPETHP